MRRTWIAGLVVLTAACGSYHFPGTAGQQTGTVTGRVIAVPCAPIEPVASECAGRPVAGLEIDYLNGDIREASTVTDSAGGYSIQLATGTYKVRLNAKLRLLSGPATVTVTPNGKLVANYVLDSGIRVPVPQQ